MNFISYKLNHLSMVQAINANKQIMLINKLNKYINSPKHILALPAQNICICQLIKSANNSEIRRHGTRLVLADDFSKLPRR